VQLNTSGQIAITNAAAAIQAVGSTVITDGTWWRVEAKYIAGTTTGSVEVRIFAGDSTTATETITASATDFGTQATEISWGMSFAPSTSYSYWLDNVAYGTIDWIGPSAPSPTFVEIDVAHGLVLGHAATANVFPPVVRPFYEDFEGETDGTAITVGNTNFTRIDTGESELSPGTLEFDTADAAVGSGSGLFTALTTDSSQAYGVFFLDDGPIQFLRFYMKPVTAGPITSLIVQLKGRGGTIDPGGGPSEDPPLPDGVIGGQLAITTGRQIRLRDQSGTNVDGTGMAALPIGEWARVEIMADTTNDVLEVRQFTGANVHGTTPSDSRQFTSYTFVPDTPGWYYGQVGLIHFNNGWTAAFDEPETSAVDWLGPVVTPVDVAVAHGIVLGHSVAAELQADVTVSHGVALGASLSASIRVTCATSHGLVLGHTGVLETTVTVVAAHGLALGHAAVVELTADVAVAHGLVLGHEATLAIAGPAEDVLATISHGIAIQHAATVQLATDVVVAHGVALGHEAEIDIAAGGAVISHGVALGHTAQVQLTADVVVSHGVALGHAAVAHVEAGGAVIAHGLVLGHAATLELHGTVSVAHGLALGHAVSGTLSLALNSTHGLILGHAGVVAVTVRVAVSGQGVALGHDVLAFLGSGVSARVAHGIVLGHAVIGINTPAARVSHGIVLGHDASAALRVRAQGAHGLAFDHHVTALSGNRTQAVVTHGIILGHASAALATVAVASSHGIVLGHAVIGRFVFDVFVEVAHGIVLQHAIRGRIGTDTTLPVVAVGEYAIRAVANGLYVGSDSVGAYVELVTAPGSM
jgi:hypothetical protein